MFESNELLTDSRLPLTLSEIDPSDNDDSTDGDADQDTQVPPEFGAPHFTPPPKVEFVDHAPIERKGIQGSAAALLYALLIAALVSIPFSLFGFTDLINEQIFNVLAIALCVGFIYYLSRAAKQARGVVPLLIFFAILLFVMMASAALSLLLLASLFFISQGSFLLTVSKKKHIPLLLIIPAVAYAATLGLSAALGFFRPLFCAVCLLPIPATVLLSVTTHSCAKRDGITRVGSICATSLGLIATLLAILAILLYTRMGEISVAAIERAMSTFRDMLFEALTALEADMGNGVEQIIPDDLALETVNATVNILPGTAIAFVNVFAFFAQVVLLGTLRTWGVIQKPVRKMFEFSMSFMSAAVFAVALIVFLIDSGDTKSSLVGTVANNLTIIFEPGLALCGIDSLTKHMVAKQQGCGLLLLAGAVLIMSVVMNFLMTALAAIGAFFIIKKLITDIQAKNKDN
ncbi:MAG: DUF2232 domain-containing protein [Clostridia bacterium]|nr:DUF2232 domain-containing protein [Clostridia bacterium]